MAKRTAERELTDTNWDEEDEHEEAGQFVQASEDVIKSRQIKKAKRRGLTGESEGGTSVFSGFSGFKSTPSGGSGGGLFSAKPSTEKTQNGADSSSNNSNGKSDSKSESEYLLNLKSLNQSVLSWIQEHVNKNPFCILTPIFKDYEKHLTELEKDKKESDVSDSSKTTTFGGKFGSASDEGKSSAGASMFGVNGTGEKKSSGFGGFDFKSATSTSSFGSTTSSSTSGGFSGFNFKTTASDLKPAFSFATGPAVQSTGTAASGTETKTGDDEDEYVPPTAEVSEVTEEGSIYTKRCKMFYQKEGKWIERGVGNIHLKLTDDKLQLVIRADTNLGNIMLNIMLSEGIPVKKQGKNNIFFVCVPNPPFNPKAKSDDPVPLLLRVKTGEDADEFIKCVEDNRK